MRIVMPDKVNTIIKTITAAGYEAYAVGGCIRDRILGREPEDWDITTSAPPERVKQLFRRTVDTGIKHGTVTVMLAKDRFEVTTYRIDGIYEDSRHPREVFFTASLADDLKRRDFTVNAMAYNETSGLIDLFDGLGDIGRAVIRCVGDPTERFKEDALRIMRAVRFSAQLGYTIEADTKAAMVRGAPNLSKISAERIRIELMKLITSPHPDYLRIAYETGITRQILPEFDLCMTTVQNNPHHDRSVGEHLLQAMVHSEPDPLIRLTMLLHDIAKPPAKTTDENGCDHFYGHQAAGGELAVRILRRLKFDNATVDKAAKLIRHHDDQIMPEAGCVRRAIAAVGEDIFPLLLKVNAADLAAQSKYRRFEKSEYLAQLTAVYQEIAAAGDCVSLKDLAITGHDLIAAGMAPGKEMGELLNRLLSEVIEHPQNNNREYLLSAAVRLARK